MRIGIVLSKTPAYSETFFNLKIKGLMDNGFEVVLFVQKKEKEFDLCPVIESPKVGSLFTFVFVLWSIIKLLVRYPKRVKTFVKLERKSCRSWSQLLKNIHNNSHLLSSHVDWLHFGFAAIALQSENIARSINSKMAISLRGYDIDIYPEKHPNCYDLLWDRVDRIHSISNYLITRAKQFGLVSNNIKVIYPAIDIKNIVDSNQTRVKDNSELKILTVARLHPIKGIQYCIEAFALLKAEGIKFKYTIIGDGSERENLNAEIKRLDLEDDIFLIGKQSHQDVFLEMEKSHIYLQYSVSEGFCNAVLEAQGKGLLSVVSDGGGLPENILHLKTGFVVPKKNPNKLAETLRNVINLTQVEKSAFIQSAKQRVISNFNTDIQEKAFIKFYEESSNLPI